MTTPNPFDALNKLSKRISDICKEEGFAFERMAAIPGEDACLEMMVTLDEEFAPKDELDEMLAGMEEATRQEELRRQAEETREGLKTLEKDLEEKLQRPSDGIL